MQRHRRPRVGRPDFEWNKTELMRKRESVLEDWLAMRNARQQVASTLQASSASLSSSLSGAAVDSEAVAAHLPVSSVMASSTPRAATAGATPMSVVFQKQPGAVTAYGVADVDPATPLSPSRNSSFSSSPERGRSRSRSRSPRLVHRREVPRLYDQIADYLVQLDTLTKQRKYEQFLTSLQDARETASKSYISERSRKLANRRRIKKSLELFAAMDAEGLGYINLRDVDDTMLSQLSCEADRAFVLAVFLPFATEHQQRTPDQPCLLSRNEFVHRAMALMASGTGPKPDLTRLHHSPEPDVNHTFAPDVSENSKVLAAARRDPSAPRQERIRELVQERTVWARKREQAKSKLAAEELAQCTFRPQVARSTTPSSMSRLLGPARRPLTGEAALTSEERQLRDHCTFRPNRSRSRSPVARKPAVVAAAAAAGGGPGAGATGAAAGSGSTPATSRSWSGSASGSAAVWTPSPHRAAAAAASASAAVAAVLAGSLNATAASAAAGGEGSSGARDGARTPVRVRGSYTQQLLSAHALAEASQSAAVDAPASHAV